MENKSTQGKWGKLITLIPNYGALAISIGGIIFSFGVLWNNVSGITSRMDKLDDTNIQVVKLNGDLALLHNQIQTANEVNNKQTESMDKLTDAVTDLGDSVSALQGKLNVMPPAKKQKRR